MVRLCVLCCGFFEAKNTSILHIFALAEMRFVKISYVRQESEKPIRCKKKHKAGARHSQIYLDHPGPSKGREMVALQISTGCQFTNVLGAFIGTPTGRCWYANHVQT